MDAEQKLNILKQKLTNELAGSDMQFSLFIAALQSYRHDTVLRPFPSMFRAKDKDGHLSETVDYKTLEKTADLIPGFQRLVQTNYKHLSSQTLLDLLHWCLATGPSLKQLPKETFSSIQGKTEQLVETTPPDYVFEVVHSEENEEKFQQRRKDRKSMYAYHGSSIENFHCILNLGLQGHMSKNALFGEGTYLSSELSICLNYSPHGRGWEQSMIGERLSCVAVCEMIDDPSVRCQVKDTKNGNLKRSPSKAMIQGSEGGEIPEKYYVVRNNDVLRVRYLLVYIDRSVRKRKQSSWVMRHKYACMLILYALILLAVGLYNSKSFHYQVRRYLQR